MYNNILDLRGSETTDGLQTFDLIVDRLSRNSVWKHYIKFKNLRERHPTRYSGFGQRKIQLKTSTIFSGKGM